MKRRNKVITEIRMLCKLGGIKENSMEDGFTIRDNEIIFWGTERKFQEFLKSYSSHNRLKFESNPYYVCPRLPVSGRPVGPYDYSIVYIGIPK